MRFGAVSAGHEITTKAAMQILQSGGNAIDAAITAYLTACVAEPCMASAGAGGFANIWMDGKNEVLDFFCQTPEIKNNNPKLIPIKVDFGNAVEYYYAGAGSMAVPGAMAGMFALHERHGSMPLKELIEIPSSLAKNGVKLSPFQHLDLELLEEIFRMSPEGRKMFFVEDKLKQIGDLAFMTDYSSFLDEFALDGNEFVYQGEIAESIVSFSNEEGGNLTMNDFKDYQALWKSPKSIVKNGINLSFPPAPSMGHALAALFMDTLSDNVAPIHSVQHRDNWLNSLIKCKELADNKPLLFQTSGMDDVVGGKLNGTSHLNVMDNKGNGISMTFSIGEGSGFFIPGTNMQMNNMLGETALLPDGLNSWKTSTRLASMMTPTLFSEKGVLKGLLGSGGAERIPNMISQVILYLSDYNLSLEEAILAPRMHLSGDHVQVECGFDLSNTKDQFHWNEWEDQSLYFGGVHAITKNNGHVTAFGDERREGYALIE